LFQNEKSKILEVSIHLLRVSKYFYRAEKAEKMVMILTKGNFVNFHKKLLKNILERA
jgi:hypothetical protein